MKSKVILRTVSLLLLFLLTLLAPLPVSASSYTEGLPDISEAKTVYFENLESGRVIAKKDGGGAIAPASTVKLMTALIALEHFEGKEDTLIEISDDMLKETAGTSMELSHGDRLSAIDLIYATLCGGFNDAAYALAAVIGGSVSGFVTLMNRKAIELGAKNTIYANPTGYDAAAAATTLRDTITVAKAAMNNPRLMEISSSVSRKIVFMNEREPFTVHNRNGLIGEHYFKGYSNPYASGMISGNTDMGGWCVVTKITINKANYLCVIMGATETNSVINSYKITNELTYFARTSLGFTTVMKKGTHICDVDIEFALSSSRAKNQTTVSASLGEDATLFIPRNVSDGEITKKYYLYEDILEAPVFEGDRIGSVDFYYNGELLKTVPLIIDEDIDENRLLIKLHKIKSAILSRTSAISFALFVLFTLAWFLAFDKKKRRKAAKKVTYRGIR